MTKTRYQLDIWILQYSGSKIIICMTQIYLCIFQRTLGAVYNIEMHKHIYLKDKTYWYENDTNFPAQPHNNSMDITI